VDGDRRAGLVDDGGIEVVPAGDDEGAPVGEVAAVLQGDVPRAPRGRPLVDEGPPEPLLLAGGEVEGGAGGDGRVAGTAHGVGLAEVVAAGPVHRLGDGEVAGAVEAGGGPVEGERGDARGLVEGDGAGADGDVVAGSGDDAAAPVRGRLPVARAAVPGAHVLRGSGRGEEEREEG